MALYRHLLYALYSNKYTIGQLNSLSEKTCEVPEPYGKYRLQFKFVPETIFYVTDEEANYADVVLTRKGLVCPILGWREKGAVIVLLFIL